MGIALKIFMRRTILILNIAFALIAAGPVAAKRGPAPEVMPVRYNGLKIVAPNTVETIGQVEAWDEATNTKVWTKDVYTIEYDPALERDVQWVFIKEMQLKDDFLYVKDENGREYLVALLEPEIEEVR